MTTLRCFVAVPLDDRSSRALERAGALVREADPRWKFARWVDPLNLHITLKFLGDVETDRIPALTDAIAHAVIGHAAPQIVLNGIEASPSPRRPRMLWATFSDPGGALESVARSIDEAVGELGFERDTRPFKPHTTLCRIKTPVRLTAAVQDAASAALEGARIRVSDPKCTLFSSRLTPSGPVYAELSVWTLGGEVKDHNDL